MRSMLFFASALVLAACTNPPGAVGDGKTQPAAAEKADAKAGATKADAKANPHAGVGAPPAPAAKGPPREITPTGKRRAEKADELSFEVPEEWETQKVGSPMRKAQFIVPGPGGDAEMVVFRFAGGAGGKDANIARWKGQFQAPEGKTIDELTTQRDFEVGGLKVTMIDITGHYKAPERPGSTTMIDEANYRMLAAIVEGSGDAFFFKLLGPGKTVDLWAQSYEDGLEAAKKS